MELTVEQRGGNFFDLIEQAADLRFDRLPEQVAQSFRSDLIAAYWRMADNLVVSESVIRKYPCFADTTGMLRLLIASIVIVESKGNFTVEIDHDRLAESELPTNLPLLLEYGHPDGIPELPVWRMTRQKWAASKFSKKVGEVIHDLR